VNLVSISVTGRIGADPRTFTTRDGTPGVELRLAVELPPRTAGGDGITRWVKVAAFGLLASRTADSVVKGDRVTVIADDVMAEAWTGNDGKPRATIALRAREIAASMAFDTLRTGYQARKAARQAAADGQPTDLPAAAHADAEVLAGVTA
jgi:single-stranded DNA-binding protein